MATLMNTKLEPLKADEASDIKTPHKWVPFLMCKRRSGQKQVLWLGFPIDGYLEFPINGYLWRVKTRCP